MKGQLLTMDLRKCDENLVKDKEALIRFCKELCNIINMVPYGEPIVERFGKGDLEGYSAVQLIETSAITIHLDEFENKAFIDIFSCKNFDAKKARDFSKEFFKAKKVKARNIYRK